MVAFDVGMGVPLAARAAIDLYESYSALDHPASQQAESSGDLGLTIVHAVK
jgi:hypothetical protein